MKKKKTRKKPVKPDTKKKDKRVETITILAIILFALLGLALGYFMFHEFAGYELQEDGHYEKIEKEIKK